MTATQSFTVTQPTRIRFGIDSINDLADMVKNFGGTKVFLDVDPGIKGSGIVEKVVQPLKNAKVSFEQYEDITPEPGLSIADKGAELAKKAEADCVVGVGGGSAMDVAEDWMTFPPGLGIDVEDGDIVLIGT